MSAVASDTISVSARRHIPSLDGLRAASFLLVFLSHAGLGDLIPGGFGVTVFFFLSGFLITTLMRSEFDRNGSVSLKHFWLRRVLRILPPFYLILVAGTACTLIFAPRGEIDPAAVASQALHFSNYRMIDHGAAGMVRGSGVYWSLAVEEHFYLIFPLVYVAMRRRKLSGRRQAAILWSICGLVLAWRVLLTIGFHEPEARTYFASDTRIDSILFGSAAAVWYNPTADKWDANEWRWKYAYVPLALLLLAVSFLYRDPVFRETARYSLQGLALAPLFVAAIRFPDWLPFRLLNRQPFTLIGTLSYSLYLLHDVVFEVLQRQPARLGQFGQPLTAFAISLGLAWTIYVLVEKPCAALRRRLAD